MPRAVTINQKNSQPQPRRTPEAGSGAREVEVEVIPPNARGPKATEGSKTLSELVAYILDDLFRVPGTNMRFGLDPVLGMLPVVGDIAAATGASYILVTAATQGVPRVVLIRMCLNVMINAILGAVPGVGDAFSFWFKSNARNHALLLKHMGRRTTGSKGDYLFVGFLLGAIALTVFLVLFLLVTLVRQAGEVWFGS